MCSRIGSYLSLLLLGCMLGFATLSSTTYPATTTGTDSSTTQQVQDELLREHQSMLDDLNARVRELENSLNVLRGAILGFGSLLGVIQGAQLLGFKRRNGDKP